MGFDTQPPPQPYEELDYTQLIEPQRIRSELYTSDTVYRDELDRIFYSDWVYVGHESEIPDAGSYITRMIGQRSVILTRTRDNQFRVLTNRCTHRGNLLATKERGKGGRFTCLYHGWTFDLEGELTGMLFKQGASEHSQQLHLQRPEGVDSYQGFIFATYSKDSKPLKEHLGRATELIDRTVQLSPQGKIRLTAGWVKHRIRGNWKMLAENAVDGYHAVVVHSSFLRTFRSHYDDIMVSEDKRKSRARDWGGGTVELDYSPTYDKTLEWFGTDEERSRDYVDLMIERYGEQDARKKLTIGPAHALIFPNLFLGEMSIMMIQPVSANEAIQWHTPVLLEGVPEAINKRSIGQSSAAIGPSAFLIPEDAVISERQQIAMRESGGWLELSRGLERQKLENGVLSGNHTDEVTQRGFWRRYLSSMQKVEK